ncbi:MAG: energy transducer TonB [Acidobacteria bacterium]|nr:MAG: energy transducer TonB [Acidobacteriota bacterium]
MSITQIPPKGPLPSPSPAARPDGSELYEPQRWESAYRKFDADNVPHLLIQLQDDLARSRKREAVWLSVIFHLLVVILVVNEARLEKYLPRHAVIVVSPNDWTRQKELTYLELPPDAQKATKRPDTNVISDKDRVASSRKPQVDPKELRKILDSARPGRPGPTVPPASPQLQQAPAVAQNAAPPQQLQQEQPAPSPSPSASQNQMARLQPPPAPKSKPQVKFGSGMSAGSAIEEAARAAVASRNGGYGGEGGDYGLGQGQQSGKAASQLDVLTDTMGVDFGPYLSRVVHEVRINWYNLIPEAARPPLMKKGKVSIEFAILKNGSVAGMRLVTTSGDVSLDRAAWGGITGSNPFSPLPQDFHGQFLGLRFHFYYNPDRTDLQ